MRWRVICRQHIPLSHSKGVPHPSIVEVRN